MNPDAENNLLDEAMNPRKELLTATCRFCGETFEHPRTDGISMLRINHEAKCQMNPKNKLIRTQFSQDGLVSKQLGKIKEITKEVI